MTDASQLFPGVAVLSFSRIARDRRVLRQCALLREMGHPPTVIAYADADEAIDYTLLRWPVPQPTFLHRLKTVARQLPAHLGGWAAKPGFWVEPRHLWALNALKSVKPRLILANDWPALVVAAAYAKRNDTIIHYDTHEFATQEFEERAFWRLVYKPMVIAMEGAAIHAAHSVSTVGPLLAEALQDHYQLRERPAVIRNIPNRISLDDKTETAWPLRILYHGQVLPYRGLETLIRSIPQWNVPHRLTIRGDGDAGYIAALKELAQTCGASHVTFEPPVAPDDVMPIAARSADVGVHFTPLGTDQRNFSLPNKLFEYIGAGLAIAVSPGVDLRNIVETHGVGVISNDAEPASVAAAINTLTHDQVVAYKAAARETARILCWEHESNILRNIVARHLAR